MDALPELLTLKQTAAVLGCSTRTLRRRIAEGALRASQVADRGGWVVQRDDLVAFLDARATLPRQAEPILPPPPAPHVRGPARRRASDGRLALTADMGRPG
jgi:excisionase family DNA binding protein